MMAGSGRPPSASQEFLALGTVPGCVPVAGVFAGQTWIVFRMSAVSGHSGAKRRQCLKAFRFMLLARVLEEKLAATLYRAGLIKGRSFLGVARRR